MPSQRSEIAMDWPIRCEDAGWVVSTPSGDVTLKSESACIAFCDAMGALDVLRPTDAIDVLESLTYVMRKHRRWFRNRKV